MYVIVVFAIAISLRDGTGLATRLQRAARSVTKHHPVSRHVETVEIHHLCPRAFAMIAAPTRIVVAPNASCVT